MNMINPAPREGRGERETEGIQSDYNKQGMSYKQKQRTTFNTKFDILEIELSQKCFQNSRFLLIINTVKVHHK